MKNMEDQTKVDPTKTNVGESPKIDESTYRELEKKFGEQGKELGDYRSFIESITPLLERLDKNPDLVQSIINDKITPELLKAIQEGKVTIGDVKIVEQANKEVKKEMGKEEYAKASPDDIAKLVEDKVSRVKEEFDSKIKESEELSEFKRNLESFIESTPDFEELAPEIEKWLDNHPKVDDIQVAYYAVKGQLSVKKATEESDKAKAEAEKNIALNATGGNGSATKIPAGDKLVDKLISGRTSPDSFL